MLKIQKMLLVARPSPALLSTGVSAHEVQGPHPGTGTATTYYPSGGLPRRGGPQADAGQRI
jgi:hypothetical protein